jgi:hypothetical protein
MFSVYRTVISMFSVYWTVISMLSVYRTVRTYFSVVSWLECWLLVWKIKALIADNVKSETILEAVSLIILLLMHCFSSYGFREEYTVIFNDLFISMFSIQDSY